MIRRDLHEQNRLAWNEATRVHNGHKRDQAEFLRSGGSTLFPEELELLGDIHGQSLVHLQCNAGQDTLSLALLGAQVTGIDISDEAISFAQQLSADSGISGTFERADVYDWLAQAAGQKLAFDLAYCSYGALCWLSNIDTWAQGIARILKPMGRLVCVEFHPLLMMFEDDWSFKYPYFGSGQPYSWPEGIGDYVAEAGAALAPSGYLSGVEHFANPHPSHEFQWTMGDIVSALLGAGLGLVTLKEYPYSNGCRLLQRMREIPGRRMIPPEDIPSMPLMFGLVAEKVSADSVRQ